MRLRPSRNPDKLVLTCVGVGSALFNLAVLAALGIRHGMDTERYVTAARSLLAARSIPGSEMGFLGYVSVLALCDAIGIGPSGSIALQLAVASLAALAAYDLGRQLAGRRAGVLAACLFVLNVDIARWHVYVLTDSLYISCVVLLTWLVHRAIGRGMGAYVAGVVGIVLTASIRPNGWIFGPIALIYWIAHAPLRKRTRYAAVACVIVVCAGGALSLAAALGGVRPGSQVVGHPPPGTETLEMQWKRWSNGGLQPGPAADRVLVELLHVRSSYSVRHNAAVIVLIAIICPLAVLGFVRWRDRPLTGLLGAVIAGHLLIVAVTFSDVDGRYLLYVFSLVGVSAASGAITLTSPRASGSERAPLIGAAPFTGPVDLSVIVPFFRDLTQLRRCLAALNTAGKAAVGAGFVLREIIVVGDGCPENPQNIVDAAGAHLLAIDGPNGPATARNRGAAIATGDVLVFVDSDVVVSESALTQFARVFKADRNLGAAFGSFDERPDDRGFVSQCKNLSHAFVHRRAPGEAQTFWSGLGAVRVDVFQRVGGFDERFRRASVEDIDLGYRIRASGSRITLDPRIEGQHLKRWTLVSAVVSEIRDRGVPWTQMLHRFEGPHNYLNVTMACRMSVIAAYATVISLLLAPESPSLAAVAAVGVLMLWWLDRACFQYFATRRGLAFALAAFPLRLLHHLCNGASFVIGSVLYASRVWANLTLPGALAMTPWPGSPRRSAAPAVLDSRG